MRAAIAIAALAVAVNAAAIPDDNETQQGSLEAGGAGVDCNLGEPGNPMPGCPGFVSGGGQSSHPSPTGSPTGGPPHPTGGPTGGPPHPTGGPTGGPPHPTGGPTGGPPHPTGGPTGGPPHPTGGPGPHPTGGPGGNPGHGGGPHGGNDNDYPTDNSGDDYDDHSNDNYDDNSSNHGKDYDDHSSTNYGDDYTYNGKTNTYGGKNYGDSSKDYTKSKSYDYDQYSSYSKDYSTSSYGNGKGYQSSYKQTPYFPSGGYSQPSSYPSGCEYSKPKPRAPPSDCDYNSHDWPYNNAYPKAGDYGKPSHGYDYHPSGHTQAAGCGVYSPARGEHVECGKKHKFVWYMPQSSHVQIDIVYGEGKDDCHHYTTVHDNCPNTGSYEWDVPQIAPCGHDFGYGILITCKDTGRKYYSPQFAFKADKFYDTCKHPACPTTAPPVCDVPACTDCTPPPPPPTCPTTSTDTTVAPPPAGNDTIATPSYEGAASSFSSSFSLVAGIAAMVALVL